MSNDRKIKVVFFPTDNNASSGAFISMTVLNEYLNKEFGVDTKIILPKEGTGTKLLEERNLNYKIIRSYDWLVPIVLKNSFRIKCVFFLKRVLNLVSILRIRNELRRIKPDLVHINTIYGYVGAVAAKKENIPIVWHFREIIEKGHDKTFMYHDFSQRILSYANVVVTVSKSVLDYYQNNGIKMNHAVVIYNGIDVPTFYNEDKKILFNDTVKILFVGDFTRNKGAFNLVEALKLLSEDVLSKVQVSFVGRSNAEFEKTVSNSKVRDRIKLYGYSKNVADIYRENDIVVTGAKYEAFGRVTSEAMLSGCLTMTANDSGSGELVKDSVTGYSFDYGNAKMLAEKITYALGHRDEARQIAKQGQKFIKENMSARQNAENIASLYKELLRK